MIQEEMSDGEPRVFLLCAGDGPSILHDMLPPHLVVETKTKARQKEDGRRTSEYPQEQNPAQSEARTAKLDKRRRLLFYREVTVCVLIGQLMILESVCGGCRLSSFPAHRDSDDQPLPLVPFSLSFSSMGCL
jgi:hypothetical protein